CSNLNWKQSSQKELHQPKPRRLDECFFVPYGHANPVKNGIAQNGRLPSEVLIFHQISCQNFVVGPKYGVFCNRGHT
ncbi:MAG: hypothetical protein NTX48_00735, partial [Planctomycetales bacterium]|nr:hypothetical protein [Planctomycetales bacterium]